MKNYLIEGRRVITETLEVTASNKQEAIKIAEETDGRDWELIEENPRKLVSIIQTKK